MVIVLLEILNMFQQTIKRGLQRTALEDEIDKDIMEAYIIFEAYLRHGYATSSLPGQQMDILQKINQEFDGKAKRALIDRFSDNNIRMGKVNRNIEFFIRNFHT